MRAAWIALALILCWQGIAQTGMNYAAPFGSCELDENSDGFADGWLRWTRYGDNPTWSDIGVSFAINRTAKVDGGQSQEIRISRSQGAQGSFVVELRPIWETRLPYFCPPNGTPLLVRGWIRAENLNNVFVQIRVLTGQRVVTLLNNLSSDTNGWLPVSMVVPLETNEQGSPRLYYTIEIFQGAGAASGRIWVDGVEVLWTGFMSPERPKPNPLKIAHYNCPVSHWQALLEPPCDFLIAPLSQVHALLTYLPNAELGIYTAPAATSDVLPPRWDEIYGGYHYVLQQRPHWLLRRQG
ncbi:MAG: hypothetical protein NZ949_07445, partial [Candidatus Kapabacteria bacterium]|nr:hypothetical protein [Candidatus Kapabacteria bacterium]